MKENIITFQVAKLAKEKGFDISTHSYYFEDNKFKENSIKGTNSYYGDEYEFNLSEFNENWNDKWLTKKDGDRCFGCSKQQGYLETFSAPTQSLLVKWLREVHKIDVVLIPERYKTGTNYIVQAQKFDFVNGKQDDNFIVDGCGWYNDNNDYPTYEDALEKGLEEGIKLIKKLEL